MGPLMNLCDRFPPHRQCWWLSNWVFQDCPIATNFRSATGFAVRYFILTNHIYVFTRFIAPHSSNMPYWRWHLVYDCPSFSGVIRKNIGISKSRSYSVTFNEKCVLKASKFKHDTFGKRAFAVYGPLTWDCLPNEFRLCDEIEAFKRNMQTHRFVISVNESTLAFWFEELL